MPLHDRSMADRLISLAEERFDMIQKHFERLA